MRKLLIIGTILLISLAACKTSPKQDKDIPTLPPSQELDKAIEKQIETSGPKKTAYGIVREPVGDTDWIMLTHPNGEVTLIHKDDEIKKDKKKREEVRFSITTRLESGFGYLDDDLDFDFTFEADFILDDLDDGFADFLDEGLEFEDIPINLDLAKADTTTAMARALGHLFTEDNFDDITASKRVYYSFEKKEDTPKILVYDKTYYAPHGGGLCTDSTCGAVVFKFETEDGDPVTASVTVKLGDLILQKNPYQIGCRNNGDILEVTKLTLPDGYKLDGSLPKVTIHAPCTGSEDAGDPWIAKI